VKVASSKQLVARNHKVNEIKNKEYSCASNHTVGVAWIFEVVSTFKGQVDLPNVQALILALFTIVSIICSVHWLLLYMYVRMLIHMTFPFCEGAGSLDLKLFVYSLQCSWCGDIFHFCRSRGWICSICGVSETLLCYLHHLRFDWVSMT